MTHRFEVARLVLPPLLFGTLSACAPAVRTQEAPDLLSTTESATICAAQPRVGDGGFLIWGAADGTGGGRGGGYTLDCPALKIVYDGQTVTVRAASLAEALNVFADEALLMSYYGDLRVRMPEPGLLTADPVAGVPDVLADEVNGVTVTVTQAGKPPLPLLVRGVITPQRFDLTSPVIVDIRAAKSANAWPRVVLDPVNFMVTATLGN